MRLRLTVMRHGLPATPIVWDVGAETATVAQLLEQVSEAVPLESGEWGLEDYAVELRGNHGSNFECLHYHPVQKVMKEDDEVVIRPLLTQDLKIRKVSGRHQISSDGKHLVDGLAFGRPLLRRPRDRPDINIPPRKRQRITYSADDDGSDGEVEELIALENEDDSEDNTENESNNQQLVLHANFDNDDSEDDEDFTPDEDDERDEYEDEDQDEVGADQDQQVQEEEEDKVGSDQDQQVQEEEDRGRNDSGDTASSTEGTSVRTMIHKLHSAFPSSPIAVCEAILKASNCDMGTAYEAMARGFKSIKPKRAIIEISQDALTVPKTRSQDARVPAQEPEDQGSAHGNTDESTNPLFDYYDQNGLPHGSIGSGTALSRMADILKTSQSRARTSPNQRSGSKSVKFAGDDLSPGFTSTPAIDYEAQIKDSEESEEGSAEETSSSGSSSSSDDESDDADSSEISSSEASSSEASSSEASSSEASSDVSSSELSSSEVSSSSDSSSDYDSAPEETSSKTSATILASPKGKNNLSKQEVRPKSTPKKLVAPRQGKKQTQNRNQRRRNTRALNRLKEEGTLPANTTAEEFRELNIDRAISKEEALAALDTIRSTALSERENAFASRRQDLLNMLESGGIEVGQSSSSKTSKSLSSSKGGPLAEPPSSAAYQNTLQDQPVDSSVSGPHDTYHQMGQKVEDTSSKEAPIDSSARPTPPTRTDASGNATPPSRRSRLDVGAGRRLLFGALGIKNPKTKKDEEKLRSDFMKDAKPLFTPKSAEDSTTLAANDEGADEDPEAWRDFVTYRAVECCQDGVELSEPPFPFVQRWDPQQRGRSQHTTKNGKRQQDRNHSHESYGESRQPSQKKRRKGRLNYDDAQEYLDQSYEPSYIEDSMVVDYGEETQSSKLPDSNAKSNDGDSQSPADLAPLPSDPSTLPDLKSGQATPGMTIAFKQLIMSEATQWQPQISTYRTAIVISALESGELHLTLALRDRERPEKSYNEETGDRIYGKFDMPMEDEDEEELEDDGILNLAFSELVEPKVVQGAPDDLVADSIVDDGPPATSSPSPDDSTTLSLVKESTAEQLSHITETSFNSVAADIPESNPPGQDSNPEGQGSDIYGLPCSPVEELAASRESSKAVERNPSKGDAGFIRTPVRNIPPGERSTEPISDEVRQEISHMMKEAGFRSSVPSSVMKDIRTNGEESPGDAAVFEQLMNDMAGGKSQPPFSPQFNGLGSVSPTGKPPRLSSSASKQASHEPSSPPPQSTWQTVASDEASSPPSETQEQQSTRENSEEEPQESWQTIDPPARSGTNNKSKRKLHKAQPVQKAKVMWEQLSRSKISDTRLLVEGPEDLPGVPVQVGSKTTDARDSNSTVLYPKLSVGSSFTSQISDHGRQPDAIFEDSTVLDTPKVATDESLGHNDVATNADPDLPPHKSTREDNGMQQLGGSTSDVGSELPLNPSRKSASAKRRGREILDNLSFSDDMFPTLEEVFSQREPKPEKTTPVPSKPAAREDSEYDKAMAAIDAQLSEDSDQPTPKASQNRSRASKHSASQPKPKPRDSPARNSRTRTTSTQPEKFVLPQGSQVMDLTLSSEVEDNDNQEPAVEDSDGKDSFDSFMRTRFKTFKEPGHDDDDFMGGGDDDEDDEEEAGWVKKKASSQRETRRRTGPPRLRTSSQASLNTGGNRRRTAPRF